MADEYIKREAACSLMPDDYYGWRDKQILKSAPSADVQPVRHGRWTEDSDPGEEIGSHWACSECHMCYGTQTAREIYRYCPNCGAKMDKEEE